MSQLDRPPSLTDSDCHQQQVAPLRNLLLPSQLPSRPTPASLRCHLVFLLSILPPVINLFSLLPQSVSTVFPLLCIPPFSLFPLGLLQHYNLSETTGINYCYYCVWQLVYLFKQRHQLIWQYWKEKRVKCICTCSIYKHSKRTYSSGIINFLGSGNRK